VPSTTYVEGDLEVAAYLEFRGFRCVDTHYEQGKQYKFLFEDPEGRCPSVAMEFLVSDEKRYADALVSMRRRLAIQKSAWSSKARK
jgi:hypothetical protein